MTHKLSSVVIARINAASDSELVNLICKELPWAWPSDQRLAVRRAAAAEQLRRHPEITTADIEGELLR